jgi:hypothetical protein
MEVEVTFTVGSVDGLCSVWLSTSLTEKIEIEQIEHDVQRPSAAAFLRLRVGGTVQLTRRGTTTLMLVWSRGRASK